ncbi:hypothetical protein GF377_07480, partial [candidate division GN15 bacterium]|nr:hypothetical protein [candidate division GN15 bacterium]
MDRPTRSNTLLLSILLVLIVAVLPVSASALDHVRVAIAGGYDEIEAFDDDDVIYVSLSELSEILGGTVGWEVVGHEVVYQDGDHSLSFLLGSSYLRLNDSLFNMTYPSRLREGQLYV